MAILEVSRVTKYFGGIAALSDVDFAVRDLEILGLIGPNGAGKSTLFDIVSGFHLPSNGRIFFKGQNITGLKDFKIARLGIGRTFQATTLFMNSTVLENVLIGFHRRHKTETWRAFLHTGSALKEDDSNRQHAMEILDFMGILALKDQLAKNLPHGHQRILGICIALGTDPKLLLLDEPATGMHPEEASALVSVIRRLRESGITVMIVEHNMQAMMNLCDRIVVLNFGKKIADGTPTEIRSHKEVIEAYLGSE